MSRKHQFLLCCVAAALTTCPANDRRIALANSPHLATQPGLRRPIALAMYDRGERLIVANRNGTLSLIDAVQNRLIDEFTLDAAPTAREFVDLAMTHRQDRLLVVDQRNHQLLVAARNADRWKLTDSVALPNSPVTVAVHPNGAYCFVASLWSRRLSRVELRERSSASIASADQRAVQSIELPFSPRKLAFVDNGRRLIVADAFAGKLGIVDVATHQLKAIRELPAHNIRGLALSADGKKLLVAHQILNDLAETTHNDVHWGVLMSNVLRWLVLDNLLNPQAELLAGSHVHLTGDSANPGADPAEIAVAADGTAFLSLSGAGELSLGKEHDYSLVRLSVGKRPTALVLSSDARRVYVANTFSDSISIVDVDPSKTQPARLFNDIALGPMTELSQAQQGELLFYDARLSSDGWFSCHSCHTDGHSNGLLTDNQGDGSFGAAKRVLSLLGVSDTAPWAWDGSVARLETQVHKSIRSTMQGAEPSPHQVQALSAFVRTLRPPPALVDSSDPVLATRIAKGRTIFLRQQCDVCHRPPSFTSAATYDVGLVDKLGNRQFNPPSLRGVGHRDRLFHDNRATGLQDVFVKYQHQLEQPLPAGELSDLLIFLRSLE